MIITDKTKPHAIFLDIDGTLCDNGKTESLNIAVYPERNLKAISKARALGHKVFINTGRGFAALPENIFDEVELDGSVTGLGTHIIVDGKTVYERFIDAALLDGLVEYTLKTGSTCRFQGGKTLLVCNSVRDLKPLWKEFSTKEQFYSLLGDDGVLKFTIDKGLEGDYLDYLSERFDLFMHSKAGEGTTKGHNKATAMKTVLDMLGIPEERSIAMGDSVNDVDMLGAAGISVAMGNAPDKVKEMCDTVTASAVEGGVGRAIEDLLF